MNKKITAIVLSAMMILSMFTYISVSAEVILPENIGTDYTAGEMPTNYFKNFSANWACDSWSFGDTETTFTHNGVTGNGAVDNSERGANAIGVVATDKSAVWHGGNVLVFGARVKNNGGVPRIKFGVYQEGRPALLPIEQPGITDGETILNTNYKQVGYTVVIPETDYQSGTQYISFGFGFAETPAGTEETKRSVKVENSSVYFGLEELYDIRVSADVTSVLAGNNESIELSAEVVNQVGVQGTLSQNFTWYALNSDRTELVEGMTITEGAEGTAALSIGADVPEGEYDIVAVSDDYAQMVKGVTVNVRSLKEDYVAGEIKNQNYFVKFTESWGCSSYTLGTTETMIKETGSRGDGVAAPNQEHGAGGVGVSVTSKEFWVAGNTIVFGAKVKNNGGLPKVKFAMWQQSYPAFNPIEAPGITDGTLVLNTEFEQIGFTMPVPESGVNTAGYTIYQFGFPETPAGEEETVRSVIIDNASVYMGIEEVYDIRLTADTTVWTPNKTEEINIDCDIINQVGVTGTLSQDVSWYAMDSERTQLAEGITITESGNGDGKIKVSVDNFTVAAGEYYIVAASKEYGELVKGIKIKVEYTPVLSVLDLTKSGNTFTASAKLLNCDSTQGTVNAMIIIVALDENNKAKDFEVQKISSTYGTAAEDCATLTAGDGVHHVNAFLWEATDAENSTITDTTLKELAAMKTLEN